MNTNVIDGTPMDAPIFQNAFATITPRLAKLNGRAIAVSNIAETYITVPGFAWWAAIPLGFLGLISVMFLFYPVLGTVIGVWGILSVMWAVYGLSKRKSHLIVETTSRDRHVYASANPGALAEVKAAIELAISNCR